MMTKSSTEPRQTAEVEQLGYFIRLFGRLSEQGQRQILAKLQHELREQEAEDAQRAPPRRAGARS